MNIIVCVVCVCLYGCLSLGGIAEKDLTGSKWISAYEQI